jgi:hypothetical protein
MALPQTYIHSSGSWRTIQNVYAHSGGSWRTIQKAWVHSGGVWRLIYDRTFVLNYSTNLSNRNIYNDAISDGWDGISNVIVNVNGITINSTNTTPSLITGPVPNGLTINNLSGAILGSGGNGGPGGGANGTAGGDAIYVQCNCVIVNTGNIWGGGGGGASVNGTNGGAGAGGGAGSLVGICSDALEGLKAFGATGGFNGTNTTGGAAGSDGTIGSGGIVANLPSGAGGSPGVAGGSTSDGFSGGAAGFAVRFNGNSVSVSGGSILGPTA